MLAVDLGASSGRVVAGLLTDNKITLEDGHRFENGGFLLAIPCRGFATTVSNIQQGLRLAQQKYGSQIASVGVDTWGVISGYWGVTTSC